MATENQSPSYRKLRADVRRWLTETSEGQYQTSILRDNMPGGHLEKIFDDDNWTDFEGVITEGRGSLVIAASCAEARRTCEIAMQAKYRVSPPSHGQAKWLRFFSPPLWYVLRRQVEVMDPDYWNSTANTLHEALRNPQWTTVPASILRGELEKYMPGTKEKKLVVPATQAEFGVSQAPDGGVSECRSGALPGG